MGKKSMINLIFQILFSKYRWFRRLIGGKWKLEWVELSHSYVWTKSEEICDGERIFIREEDFTVK